ncbi:MAG TPA: F0F1 ATP synthase subunit delta [Candidatus Saccharimonadales bacterium]|nr:F0F1 ATP synthase subunit delta [Candidatus Saccharimonadales bacterium]
MSLAEDVAMRLRGARKPKGLAKEIAAYLIENDKTAEINSLERDIIEIRSEKTGVVELTAITAHPLQQKQLDEIKRNVKKLYPACKEVIVDQVQDDSLIGGIRLEFANHLLDLSASSKLNKLRKLIS